MRKSLPLIYPAQLVRDHRYDDFLQSLFLPEIWRTAALSVFALDVELAHVRAHVSDAMLAQIRFAWWEESLIAIADSGKPRQHPVLEALAVIINAGRVDATTLINLVTSYREYYPELPPESLARTIMDDRIRSLEAKQQKRWHRAGQVISDHRKRHGNKKNNWLMLKLLWK